MPVAGHDVSVESVDIEGDVNWLAAKRRYDVVNIPSFLGVTEVHVHAVSVRFKVSRFRF